MPAVTSLRPSISVIVPGFLNDQCRRRDPRPGDEEDGEFVAPDGYLKRGMIDVRILPGPSAMPSALR